MILTMFSFEVFASTQATNYQTFLKEHKNGTIYTPQEYSKTKNNNYLFIEEFYSEVFTPIKLNTLKPNNDISTSSSTEELYDFFNRLYAGDIVKIGETYSIYISQTKNGVQLYDVDNPINDGKNAVIHHSSYNYASLKELGKTILSYQPNGKNYDILGKTSSINLPVWKMSRVSKDNVLRLEKEDTITVALELDGVDVTMEYVYTISDNSVAYYSGGKIIAKSNGVTYLNATPRNNNNPYPESLKIQVVAKSIETKYPASWEINGLNGDTLYLAPNEEISFEVFQKKGGVRTYLTNELQFKVGNTSVAQVKGNKLTALKEGETTLTAYSYYDDIPAPNSLIIIVDKNHGMSVDTNTPSWTITGLTSDVLTVKSLENVKFSLYVVKNGKRVEVTDEFNYSTRNTSVAFVDNNRIYGIEPGSTTLTATPKTTQYNSPNSLQIMVVEDLEDDKDKDKTDEDKRPIGANSYYTFWHGIGSKENTITMHIGEKLTAQVYLQDGTKIKDVTDDVDITTSDKNIVYIKNSNTLVATQKGTVTISGRCRGNFAPHPETITIEVVDKKNNYSDKNKPIWTIDGMDNDKLAINISNYISRYITTGTISETGINDTTDFMTFDTEDHKVAIVKKDGTIEPVSIGITKIFAKSKYAEQFVPEPLVVEVYENKGEDGEIFFAIDDKKPETLRLQPKEEVPFKIFLINKDGTQEDLTTEMSDRVQISGDAVYIYKGAITGKELGTATLSIDVEGYNFIPHNLEVTVRNISLNDIYQKNAFKDLHSSHWAYNYIMELARKKIINGFEDNTFRPDENITLEQAMKMIVEAKKEIISNGFHDGVRTPVKFYNISPWAQQYTEDGNTFIDPLGAFKQGFYGNRFATRIEILNMLEYASALSYDGEPVNLTEFKDFNLIPSWGYTSAELLASHNIVEGDDKGYLNPTSNITRAEMSKLLYLTFYSDTLNEKTEEINSSEKNLDNNKKPADFCELYGINCNVVNSNKNNFGK